ncbi:MAG: hypothetical protein EOO12_08235 [Chitinophagaceae bacterium]|nr:MAG: hypothetical protein EOO12_08235 [Chitinophagaceae bacterium]
MNDADQILARFHPVASRAFFGQLHAFEEAVQGIDRAHNERIYGALREQHLRSLRGILEDEARNFLQQHQGVPQLGAIDLHLRQLIQGYLHRFVQHCG